MLKSLASLFRFFCLRLCTIFLSAVLFCTILLFATHARAQDKAKRVVVVSWDGAADWVIDRLLAEGKLPNVARLAQTGVRAEYCTPAFPSKTACGHAALWTGAGSDVNGITGNSVPQLPRGEHTLLETQSGFLSSSLRAEPLFVTAAKAGKKVLILSATQSFPPDPWLSQLKNAGVKQDRFTSFDGFESGFSGEVIRNGTEFTPVIAADIPVSLPSHKGEVKSVGFVIGTTSFRAYVYDDVADPVSGFDTVFIRRVTDTVTSGSFRKETTTAILKPVLATANTHAWSPRFAVSTHDANRGDLFGYTYFRLFDLDPKTGRMTLLQRAVNGLRGASTPKERQDYLDAYGGFHSTPWDQYKVGELGKTLWQGGDGEAERHVLETVRFDIELLKRGTRYGLQHYKPDLLFHYCPNSDGAGHTWMGVLDPDSPKYDARVAAKLWPFYAQVFELQDEWLGEIIEDAGKDAAVCLVSDHGMAGAGNRFSPNAVLEAAGLLKQTPKGDIDLSATKICAPPWGDYLLTINGTEWKNGIVAPGEWDTVLQRATDALLSYRDSQGKPLVTRIFRASDIVGLGMGGVAGGDLYLDLAPGYVPTARLQSEPVQADASPIGSGVHGFFPLRAKMQAICFIGGAGVVPEKTLAGMRQIDVAPTIARLLNIPLPANATGHVIGEALRR